MSGVLVDALVALLAPNGVGGRRRSVPPPPPRWRPTWWKALGVGLLLLQQIPVVIGAAWLLRIGFEFGSDELLMIVGLIVFAAASLVATAAAVAAVWAVVIAWRVWHDHGHAQWYLGGFGLAGVLFALPLVWGGITHPLVVLLAAVSGALPVLAVGAPAEDTVA